MSKSLYRKYRSRGFDDIVGQSHVTELLKNSIKKKSFAHAYLFTGPRGTGKTSVARILAHAINDLAYTDDNMHLDIIEIDAASNRRIDDIRDLREKVHIAPSSAKYKVYIIDEVHMLTGESFNALLKTLEEPPAHVVFILATTELHKVPATIVSRTQRFSFRPGTEKDIVGHLTSIANQENISIDNDALELIAQHSDGGFRDSVSLLDQVSSLADSTISRENVESLIGLAPSSSITNIISALIAKDPRSVITLFNDLTQNGISAIRICEQLIAVARKQAPEQPELYSLIDKLVEIPRSHSPELKLIATLAQWSSVPGQSRETTATLPAKPEVPPSAPIVKQPTQTPSVAQRAEPTNNKKSAPTPKTPASKPSIPITDFEWNSIVSDLKESAPALYSVAKNANASYRDNTLRLEVGFALHRKKIQTDKYMSQLVKCIEKRYGTIPEIKVSEPAKKSLDSLGQNVADIMGGGEAI